MATHAQIAAVRKVLYDSKRSQRLKSDLESIEVLMNLNPAAALPQNDIRVFAGSGPDWWVRGTGALDPSVAEAARRCDSIASNYLAARHDLAAVNFPVADKTNLRLALAELAASWTARGAAWRAAPGQDVDSAVASIEGHLQASATAMRKVPKYVKKVSA